MENQKESEDEIFEEILFKNEKMKRHKKKLTWKHYYKE